MTSSRDSRGSRAGWGLNRFVASQEGDRVTTLELFFDLAFVFAFTQLSRLMAQQHDAWSVLEAMITLALLWWTWTAYGWLANLAHADQGVVRVAMVIGMAAVFVAGVAVPEAYDDLAGGLSGPAVLVAAYLVARLTHAVVFVLLSTRPLRRRTLLTMACAVVPSGALLVTGVVLGSPWQVWCALAAVAVEPYVSYRTSTGVEWPIGSTTHFTERHGLIVILALGESILAIGVGVSAEPISVPILVGVVLSIAITVAMWSAYFTRLALPAEHALSARRQGPRARAATDGYTYLHLVLVAGIVLAALGLEVAMAHIEAAEPFGGFGGAALAGGVACYLAGTALFARRVIGGWEPLRLAGAAVLVAGVPVVAAVPPMVALAVVCVALSVLLLLERRAGAPAARVGPAPSRQPRATPAATSGDR
ncbi:low temperature requirement protein A [Alloalcanivorax gelatiniphagus]